MTAGSYFHSTVFMEGVTEPKDNLQMKFKEMTSRVSHGGTLVANIVHAPTPTQGPAGAQTAPGDQVHSFFPTL